MNINVYLPDIVGKGYKNYWNFEGRYRICKGSRASKKSKTTALNLIFRLVKHKQANLLVVRKTYSTIKDSCFNELKWAIDTLMLSKYFEIKYSPLEITYLPTLQKIYFRGLDDPLKITSITVQKGVLCWLWIEEAYEIDKEEDFDILQESIRGKVPKDLFKQITLTLNPWNENHWIKKRFFDVSPNNDLLAITTNYKINEWLDAADLKMFENMKEINPKRYNVAGLGNWGITDGLIYENFVTKNFDINYISNMPNVKIIFGLDFGYSNDPTALFCAFVDTYNKIIYVFDEIYKKSLTNMKIYDQIFKKGYQHQSIIADSSEPKSIDELRELGLTRIKPAIKGKDSVNNGIQFIQNFHIVVHLNCKNFINEISNYSWAKDNFGKSTNTPIDKYNHLLDAMRYAIKSLENQETFSFY